MRFIFGCVTAVVIGVACGGHIEGDQKQGGDTSTTTTKSGGFCCPLKGTSCSCAGGGGWAESEDECKQRSSCTFDWAVKVVTDEHGCAMLQSDSTKCCGCPPG